MHDGFRISYREAEVILCCARGYTNQQTADALFLSYHTVKAHKDHLKNRFCLKGHNALTIFSMKLLPKIEEWVKLPTKIGNSTH